MDVVVAIDIGQRGVEQVAVQVLVIDLGILEHHSVAVFVDRALDPRVVGIGRDDVLQIDVVAVNHHGGLDGATCDKLIHLRIVVRRGQRIVVGRAVRSVPDGMLAGLALARTHEVDGRGLVQLGTSDLGLCTSRHLRRNLKTLSTCRGREQAEASNNKGRFNHALINY